MYQYCSLNTHEIDDSKMIFTIFIILVLNYLFWGSKYTVYFCEKKTYKTKIDFNLLLSNLSYKFTFYSYYVKNNV